jgi:tetratricopeptide (TPR) repeat protein
VVPSAPMGRRDRVVVWRWGALALSVAALVHAAPPKGAPPAAPAKAVNAPAEEADPQKREARVFFERAKELYAAGRYREAAEHLELALQRDPDGKDLVYNLALVRERLGEPEEAIVWVDRYLAMKLEPQERQRAESFRRRLEGARDEIAEKRRKVVVVPVTVERERAVDAWVWGPAIGAGVAATAAAVLGGVALSTRPSGFVSGRDGTFDDLAARTSEAHTYAIGADVAWVVSAVCLGAAAWAYFGREPVPVATRAQRSEP